MWVGLNSDLVSGSISITGRCISKFIAFIDKFLQSAPYVTTWDCASITGHIMSMSPVLGNLTPLKTRFLYKVIDSRSTWDSRFNIGLQNDCLSEIFWENNIVSLNSRNIVPYQAPFLLSFSDASNVACGAYLVGTEKVSHGMWSSSEAEKSSTWRELKAVHFALTSFKNSVQGKSAKWHSDTQGAVRIVDIGSPNTELHSIALDIFDYCRNFNVSLFLNGFPESLILVLMISATLLTLTTTQQFFAHLDHIWGPHTVDRFANALNAHLPIFNSRFRVLGTEAFDAFSVSWTAENNWLVLPVHCIVRVI